MSDQAPAIPDDHAIILAPFGKSPELVLQMGKIREAEHRIIEARLVNPSTYADLEASYNEAYRDLKRHLSSVGYQIALTEKALEQAKADIFLDTYPKYLEVNNIKKTNDNSDLRKAFMYKDSAYLAALDRFNQLKALESNFDGKIKVFENVCRYMRQKMQLIIRSGLSGADYSSTAGRK
jgi:hypothetical protein